MQTGGLMPQTELSSELVVELDAIMDDYEDDLGRGADCRDELYVSLVEAVRRDFALAGVRARGLTSEQAREQGKLGARLGGRPRAGETPEEARMRRLGLSTGEIRAVGKGGVSE